LAQVLRESRKLQYIRVKHTLTSSTIVYMLTRLLPAAFLLTCLGAEPEIQAAQQIDASLVDACSDGKDGVDPTCSLNMVQKLARRESTSRVNAAKGSANTAKTKPNIVFILMDDLDSQLTNFQGLTKTRKLLAQARGSLDFKNSMVAAPICCVNRASLFTGMHMHNTKTFNNSVEGGCFNAEWAKTKEYLNYGTFIQKAGYETGYFGKYQNTYCMPKIGTKKDGFGMKYRPPGWSRWFGLCGQSRNYNYSVVDEKRVELHGTDMYFTTHLKQKALQWIETVKDKPFMAVLAVPAPHLPADVEPKYAHVFENATLPHLPNWDCCQQGKHHLVSQRPQMNEVLVKEATRIYRNRLGSLLSVDDLVEETMAKLEKHNLLNNTYVFFHSDNGFHSGQFGFPVDKRLPYEFDTRVPLLVRTPFNRAPEIVEDVVSSIDLTATFMDIAGVRPLPKHLDGISFKKKLTGEITWPTRREALVEYAGEDAGALIDETANTYACIRRVQARGPVRHNDVYCRFFQDVKQLQATDGQPYFEEYYDLDKDPYQINNAVNELSRIERFHLSARVNKLRNCSGKGCHSAKQAEW